MVFSRLREWLVLFAIVLGATLGATASFSRLLQMSHDYGEMARLQVLLETSVWAVQLENNHDSATSQQFYSCLGVMEFDRNLEQLIRISRRLSAEDCRSIDDLAYTGQKISRLCGMSPTPGESLGDLSRLTDLYMQKSRAVTERLANDSAIIGSPPSLLPIVVMVGAAWFAAILAVYIAVFRLSYGYDLFMRDYA